MTVLIINSRKSSVACRSRVWGEEGGGGEGWLHLVLIGKKT